jgi:hypothetical protein
MEIDGFRLVSYKSRKKGDLKTIPIISFLPKTISLYLSRHREKLLQTNGLITILNPSLKFTQIVCFGLGSLSNYNSQIQLSYLLLISEFYKCSLISAYDPIASNAEIEFLYQLGVNTEYCTNCFKTVTEPTLFYMIHCETWMYANVIQANKHQMESIIVIGNSFKDLGFDVGNEVKFPNDLIFNNTSINTF